MKNYMQNVEEFLSLPIKNKIPCFFISPHLDDAVFSAGSLIANLAKKISVSVITVFTENSHSPMTFSARKTVKLCGYRDADKFFEDRRKEDIAIIEKLGAKYFHLGFEDALWRKKKVGGFKKFLGKFIPEIIHTYPFYRTSVISGKISSHDSIVRGKIKETLTSLIKQNGENFLVFCPLGVGNHVDHIITRDACAEIFPDAIFWSDFPYNISPSNDNDFLEKRNLTPHSSDEKVNTDRKKEIILAYKTQSTAMFQNNPKIVPEIFYIKNKVSQKPKVSIGIPAYNEEANIKNLLTSLLSQKQNNFALLEIIVVSDGSTDNTAKEAESIKDSRIKVIEYANRRGKPIRQNQILEMSEGDIFVLLDSDILPKDYLFLYNLIKPFLKNEKISLVSGNGTPLLAKTFVEKIINFSVAMKKEITESYNKGDNIYACHGYCRAFSKEFAKSIKWRGSAGEDAYSYLFCKKEGLEFYFEPHAEIVYRSPQTLKDHLRQSVRFFHSQKALKNYFPEKFIKENYLLPKILVTKKAIKYFFKNPILFLCYLSICSIASISSKFLKMTDVLWRISSTSKTLK